MIRKIFNFALFQAGWFACVLGGAHHMHFAAVVAAAVVVAVNLRWFAVDWVREMKFYATVAVIGFCVDSIHLDSGVFNLMGAPRYPHLCPVWLVALWAMFGTTFHGSLSWLKGRYYLAAVLGAAGGTLSYLGGARLGAVTLNPSRLYSVTALAVGWAAVMPLLVWLAHLKIFCADKGRETK